MLLRVSSSQLLYIYIWLVTTLVWLVTNLVFLHCIYVYIIYILCNYNYLMFIELVTTLFATYLSQNIKLCTGCVHLKTLLRDCKTKVQDLLSWIELITLTRSSLTSTMAHLIYYPLIPHLIIKWLGTGELNRRTKAKSLSPY